MAALFVIDAEQPCPQCEGKGQRLNGSHCDGCFGTGRMLAALGSVLAADTLLEATDLRQRLDALERRHSRRKR